MAKKKRSIIVLLGFIVVPLILGAISSLLAGDIKAVYNGLNTPPLSPPDWIFGIVWTILYILMGVAAYLVYSAKIPSRQRNKALIWFGIQLFLNIIWSPIFFGLLNLWLAVIVVIALDIAALITAVLFFRVKPLAGILMVPYVAWIFFASYLTVGCALLN